MKICTNCGAEIPDRAKFCYKCGWMTNRQRAHTDEIDVDVQTQSETNSITENSSPDNIAHAQADAAQVSAEEDIRAEQTDSAADSALSSEAQPDQLPESPVPHNQTKANPSTHTAAKPGKFMQIVKVAVYLALFVRLQYAVTFIFIFLQTMFFAITGTADPFKSTGSIETSTVTIGLISNLLFIGIVTASVLIRRHKLSDSLGMRRIRPSLIPAFVMFGASSNVLLSVLMNLIPWPSSVIESHSSSYSDISVAPLPLTILSISIVTGLAEEILFRSIIITRLRRAFSRTFAVAASCVVFAVFHITPIGMTYTFIFAVFLGLIYNKYDSVWTTAICHAAFNLTSLFLGYITSGILSLAVILAATALFILSLYLIFRRNSCNINTTETQEVILSYETL